MDDQTPLANPKLASEGLAQKFGDWCRDLALDHLASEQEICGFMAHSDSTNQLHQLIYKLAAEYQATKPLLERRSRFTLMLGGFKSKEDMITAVVDDGHEFTDWARQIIYNKKFTLMTEAGEYEFFETTVKELTGRDRVIPLSSTRRCSVSAFASHRTNRPVPSAGSSWTSRWTIGTTCSLSPLRTPMAFSRCSAWDALPAGPGWTATMPTPTVSGMVTYSCSSAASANSTCTLDTLSFCPLGLCPGPLEERPAFCIQILEEVLRPIG